MRRLILIHLLMVSLAACGAPQPLSVEAAREALVEAWSADQHTVWEIDWPAAPVGGPVTVEIWQAGSRYRYEILEATAPALVGETLVFDGQRAWQFNRFDAPPRGEGTVDEPGLSPVSDAFAIITRLMSAPPEAARQEFIQLRHQPAQKITLFFATGDQLSLWRDEETGLPSQVMFSLGEQQARLRARSFEPLRHPPEGLFKP